MGFGNVTHDLFRDLDDDGSGTVVYNELIENLTEAAKVDDEFLLHWFDFLAFAFSGLPSDGTVAAAMVYMLAELHKDGSKMDYPVGGSGGVVDALVRGLERHGGTLKLRTPVSELLLEGDDAASGIMGKFRNKLADDGL